MNYQELSPYELIRWIVEHSDRKALEELHNNRGIFIYDNSPPMPLIDFLSRMRESTARRDWPGYSAFELADTAYNLVVDKFSNMHNGTDSSSISLQKVEGAGTDKGPDCLLYFKAFLERAKKSFDEKQADSQFEAERRTAALLQGFVRRHFYLSLLEAKRRLDPFWSRYNYDGKGARICVWLPKVLKGHKRRDWLENHTADIDFSKPEARLMVQEIIDQKLIKEMFVSLNEELIGSDRGIPQFWFGSDEDFTISLATVVADEKAANINRQRRSIKALGKVKLRQLVLSVFENIADKEDHDGKLAKRFSLSQATYSRFAGSRWFQTESVVPDLWLNTAHILATNGAFREVAKEAGAWQQIQGALGTSIGGSERG